MTKDEIIKKLRDMAKYPTVTLPRDCEALKAAADLLAQQEQEPVAWANRVVGGRKWLSIHASKGASDRWLEYRLKEQAQGEQYKQVALYTSPPQRKPLTDEEIKDVAASCMWWVREQDILDDAIELSRAIEAAHGITGEQHG